jgi:basic membrane protein A
MSKSRFISLITVCVIFALVFSACGGVGKKESSKKVALITWGLVSGDPYNALAYAGLQKAQKDFGLEISVNDSGQNESDWEATFRDYASQGYNMVIGHGWNFVDVATKVAADYPNTFFVVIGGVATGTNLASVLFEDQYSGYLAGVMAAKMTKSGIVGTIAGEEGEGVYYEVNSFNQGVKATNPDVKLMVVYAGAWDDPAKGNELALSLIQAGADIINHYAAATGQGGLAAAEKAGVWGINDVTTCKDFSPNTCLVSHDVNFDNIVYKIIQMHLNGELEGKDYYWGLAEKAVGLGTVNKNVPQAVIDDVNAVRDQMLSGKLALEQDYSVPNP